MPPHFRLNHTLATDVNADPDDLVNVKKALHQVGLFAPEDGRFHPFTDDATFNGIRMFQATNGLTVDGRMNPGGPTEARLKLAQAIPNTESRSRQLPIPIYQNGKRIEDPNDWRSMHDAVDRAGLGSGQRRAFMEIFSAEGGTRTDEDDADVVAGLSPGRVLELSQIVREVGLPERTHPSELTPGERVAFYWTFFKSRDHSGFERSLGDNVLDRIGDDDVAASIADVVFRRGIEGSKTVQEAVNLVQPGRLGKPDGRIGPLTLAALQEFTADPVRRRRLLDEIANVRIDKLNDKSATFKGEKLRAEHFRFKDR